MGKVVPFRTKVPENISSFGTLSLGCERSGTKISAAPRLQKLSVDAHKRPVEIIAKLAFFGV